MFNSKGSREFQPSTYIYFMIAENSLANGSPKFARSYTPARFAKDLKYEGSKVPDEETSVEYTGWLTLF